MGHCHLYPLHSWQDILLTFAEMELDNTTMFPPGTNVMFIRSTGEPVLAQVVGYSEHGDAYRRITYDHDGKTVLHDHASVRRLSVPHAPSPLRLAQCEASYTEVVWVKSAHGVSGMRHSFGNKLYFTRDIPGGKWVPKNLLALTKPPTKKAKPPPKSATQSIPLESGEHVQEFKVKWSTSKKFYTEPVKELVSVHWQPFERILC